MWMPTFSRMVRSAHSLLLSCGRLGLLRTLDLSWKDSLSITNMMSLNRWLQNRWGVILIQLLRNCCYHAYWSWEGCCYPYKRFHSVAVRYNINAILFEVVRTKSFMEDLIGFRSNQNSSFAQLGSRAPNTYNLLTLTLPFGGILASIPAVARTSRGCISTEYTGSGFPFSLPPPCHNSSGV